MTVSGPDPAILSRADLLVQQGKLAAAAQLLEQAFGESAASVGHWLQLAGLRRALRQPHRALAAVHRGLELAPLDFMGLVMRAGLLERIGDPDAGLAWEQALAQRPAGALAPALADAVAAGERVHAEWLAQRGERLARAGATAEASANADEAWRIARFRTNVLRQTKVYHSEPTHFHYPGLVEREYHPPARFPWLAELEAATEIIRGEMTALLASKRAELVPYLQYQSHEPLAQWRELNQNTDWTAVHLLKQGVAVEQNAMHCPRTMELLARLPQPVIPGASPNAMFSLLAPNTAIPAHVGVNNARLVCHLPLIVPPGCWFRVGAETRLWEAGKAFVFDDTIEHEAVNPSDQLRIIMIFDVWHPDLTPLECAAVAATIAAEDSNCEL